MDALVLLLQTVLLVLGAILWRWLNGLPDSLHRQQEQLVQQELAKELEKLRASFARELELLKISQSQIQPQKAAQFVKFANLQRKMLTDKKLLAKVKAGDTRVTVELQSQVHELATGLFFFASDEAVRDYGLWKEKSTRGDLEGIELLRALGKLMVVLRRDLGYADTQLTEDDFLRLFVTDWYKYRDRDDARGEGEPA